MFLRTVVAGAACAWLASTAFAQNPFSPAPFTVDESTDPSPSSHAWRVVPHTAFNSGERFSYVIKWGVVTGGYSSLSVQGIETVNGRPAYRLVEEARSSGVVDAFYRVRDRNDAWLDTQSLVTVRYEKKIREGKYRIEETAVMDQARRRYALRSYRIDKNIHEEKEGPLPPDILDVFGSLYYVRTLPLQVGASYTFDVFTGDKVWPLVVNVKKREKIRVPAGRFDCLLVEPLLREPGLFVPKGKNLEVWLTDDERRIPVRMRSEVFIGHVAAELL